MDVREAFRNHLATQSIVRAPSNAGPLPPLWIEPRNGVPAPGEGTKPSEVGATAVLGVFLSGGITQPPKAATFIRQQNLDLWIRTTTAPAAATLADSIRAQIDDKFNWSMGGLTVIHSRVWKELQPIELNEQAFTYVIGFGFELYV
jgi:hypothetical protein